MTRMLRTASGRVAFDRVKGGQKIPHVWTQVPCNDWVRHLLNIGDLEEFAPAVEARPESAELALPRIIPGPVEDEPGERIIAASASIAPEVAPVVASSRATAPANEPPLAASPKTKRSPRNGV